MNTVEVYLIEVHSEEPYNSGWCKEFPDREFVEVTATWNSYGHVYDSTQVYNTKMWNEIKEAGYYLG